MHTDKTYKDLRGFLSAMPVIDTHEHFDGPTDRIDDPLTFLRNTYYGADHALHLRGMKAIPPLSKNDLFRLAYEKTKHTTYAKPLQIVLRDLYGLEPTMSDEMIERFGRMRLEKEDGYYEMTIKKCNIKASIVHLKGPAYDITPFTDMVSGIKPKAPGCFYTIPISPYCDPISGDDIRLRSEPIGREVKVLDDYIEAIDKYIADSVSSGAVAFKDYSAYYRALDYSAKDKESACLAFERMLASPAQEAQISDRITLGNYLTDYVYSLAGKYRLPVQIHTGHLAGLFNDIRRSNAAGLIEMFQKHQSTRFSLLHANWPYMEEALFLGKSFPNVTIDLCWTQIIESEYSMEFLKRALRVMPHSHIFAFGGDTRQPEWIYAHLEISKDNVAHALADLIDSGELSMQDARQIALDIFYNNPNEYFSLGLPEERA